MSRKIIIALSFLAVMACSYDTADDVISGGFECPEEQISYRDDVVPILRDACYACHDLLNMRGGIVLTEYDDVKAGAENGSLIGTIRHENGFLPMPQGADMLSECNIQILQIWIDEGIQDN